jgi:hypothetical protein
MAAVDQPHVDEQALINLPIVMNGYDVRFAQARDGVRLAPEPPLVLAIRAEDLG